MKRYILTITIALCAICVKALTVDDIINNIKSNNIILKAIEESKNRAINNIKSTNNLSNPEVGFEYHKGSNISGNKYGFSVTQKIEWPGIYISRTKVNQSRIAVENAKQINEYLNILLDAKQLCIQLVNLNRKINIQQEVVTNISQLYTVYDKGFKHGEISIVDINKLKIEMLNVQRAFDELKAQRVAIKEQIIQLNGDIEIDQLTTLMDYPTQSLETLECYLSEVVKFDPTYIEQMADVEAMKKNLSVSKMGWLPDFSLSYMYTNELGTKFNGFAVGASVPIFANRNKVGASKSELIAKELSQKDILIKLESTIKAEYSHVVIAKSQMYSYSNILESGNNEKILMKALEGGQMSLLDYLLELRYFLEARPTLLDLELEYNSLLTSLNKYQLLN